MDQDRQGLRGHRELSVKAEWVIWVPWSQLEPRSADGRSFGGPGNERRWMADAWIPGAFASSLRDLSGLIFRLRRTNIFQNRARALLSNSQSTRPTTSTS
jgi:hypothetical protein